MVKYCKERESAILINVPHSSIVIPEEERQYFTTEFLQREINVMTDRYCDDLFSTEHSFFSEKGYVVGINRPFSGSIVPLRYYRKNKNVMSVMIELNRKLYMNKECEKTAGYEQVKKDVARAVEILNNYISEENK